MQLIQNNRNSSKKVNVLTSKKVQNNTKGTTLQILLKIKSFIDPHKKTKVLIYKWLKSTNYTEQNHVKK